MDELDLARTSGWLGSDISVQCLTPYNGQIERFNARDKKPADLNRQANMGTKGLEFMSPI